jgi:DNA-binding response OmpR family regulator
MVLPSISLEQLWLHLLLHPNLHDQVIAALPSRKLHIRLSTTRDHTITEIWQRCPDLLMLQAADDYMGIAELCKQVRNFFSFPIIVVEQGCNEAERIALLDSGADDVVALEEGLGSLWVRMKAIARRAEQQRQRNPESLYLIVGALRLDIRGRRLIITLPDSAEVAPGTIDLTLRQTMLLALLFYHHGGVVADAAMARHMFGTSDEAAIERVTATFEQLRRRLGELRRQPLIERVHNRGYRLVSIA